MIMKRTLIAAIFPILLLGTAAATAQTSVAATGPTQQQILKAMQPDALKAAIAGEWRDPANIARNRYRHPVETLYFFDILPNQTVIEITPGNGWYSEILAPYLHLGVSTLENGQYVATVSNAAEALHAKFDGSNAVYGEAEIRRFDSKQPIFGPDASADAVLTFRNVHNWVAAGNAQDYFKAFFDVLKPGGTLGVVDHRAKPGADLETMKKSGYLTEELVIVLATQAGFVLVGKSEINANPADTTDHPNGVWTLPPTNRHDAADDAKYQAIGESDRMTLRFVKPAA
jgi:predicted methyltransferase